MRTRTWIIALAGVLAWSAAHAQTLPPPAPPTPKAAPPQPAPERVDARKTLRLGADIGELVKAAYEQQQAARLAAQAAAKPAANAAADAEAAAVAGAEVAAASRDPAATTVP